MICLWGEKKFGNEAAMQEFMGYLMTERGYSEKTKEAYQRDLNDFCQFLEIQESLHY